ncbi:hypothetical protein FB45DRAFT_886333 [Roridomyces roridus]|uniref:Uncharacterized protein n=1 Tax=Roridomyces roridus TaxID=1738132 RepID=A0AAD7FY49_9AGAR|nr:hypothetical protein FB45DRAFT_886333 [Roridomyces roridus]
MRRSRRGRREKTLGFLCWAIKLRRLCTCCLAMDVRLIIWICPNRVGVSHVFPSSPLCASLLKRSPRHPPSFLCDSKKLHFGYDTLGSGVLHKLQSLPGCVLRLCCRWINHHIVSRRPIFASSSSPAAPPSEDSDLVFVPPLLRILHLHGLLPPLAFYGLEYLCACDGVVVCYIPGVRVCCNVLNGKCRSQFVRLRDGGRSRDVGCSCCPPRAPVVCLLFAGNGMS